MIGSPRYPARQMLDDGNWGGNLNVTVIMWRSEHGFEIPDLANSAGAPRRLPHLVRSMAKNAQQALWPFIACWRFAQFLPVDCQWNDMTISLMAIEAADCGGHN